MRGKQPCRGGPSRCGFPNAEELTSGTLNALAFAALRNGSLPAGAKFPDGSLIVKDVRTADGVTAMPSSTRTPLTAMPAKVGGGPSSAQAPSRLLANRGATCVSCHSLERGR